MKDKLIAFFKNLSKLEWVTVFFLTGAFWMLIGLVTVLATPAPDEGALIMVMGLGMVMIAIPLIFICSFRRALRKVAQEETSIPEPDPISAPTPTPKPDPIPAPTPIPQPAEPTSSIPKVQPQPKLEPRTNCVFLIDELNLEGRSSLSNSELGELSGMTVALARSKEGYVIQMARSLNGSIQTERFSLPADYFKTNSKNDFRIELFKHSIFRVDVDLLWDDPTFLAII